MNFLFKKNQKKINFKPFVFDQQLMKLTKKGFEVPVGKLPLKLLKLLISNKSHVFTRCEIKQTLWPNSELIDTNKRLNTAVRALRLALDEDANDPKYFETVRHIGYRWVAKKRLRFNSPLIKSFTPALSLTALFIAVSMMFFNEKKSQIKTERIKILVSKNTDSSELPYVLKDLIQQYSDREVQFNIRAEFLGGNMKKRQQN